MADLDDALQFWGEDLRLSPTGDIARASGADRSQLRVLRRILTNPGDYLFHRTYGGGLGAEIGQVCEPAKIRARIRGQMRMEPSVKHKPEPVIAITPLPNGVTGQISYVVKAHAVPVTLSFSASA